MIFISIWKAENLFIKHNTLYLKLHKQSSWRFTLTVNLGYKLDNRSKGATYVHHLHNKHSFTGIILDIKQCLCDSDDLGIWTSSNTIFKNCNPIRMKGIVI